MERLFLLTARSRALPVWARYAITTVLVLLALWTHVWLVDERPGVPLLLFFPGVLLTGVVFDRGTGIYAAFLSSFLALWCLRASLHSFALLSEREVVTLLIFLATSVFSAFLMEALHLALERAAVGQTELEHANARLRAVADERALLLSESVHRARNDLARLSATINLQARAAEPEAQGALKQAAERIAALARLNDRLDRHRGDGRPEVDSRGFLRGLAEDLQDVAVTLPVTLTVDAEQHVIPMVRAVPIGLIVNELVINAVKYAFPDEEAGQIEIRFRRDGGEFELTVEDNGIGFESGTPPQGTGLGARLSRAFAAQLGGTLKAAPAKPSNDRPGVRWTLRFPAVARS